MARHGALPQHGFIHEINSPRAVTHELLRADKEQREPGMASGQREQALRSRDHQGAREERGLQGKTLRQLPRRQSTQQTAGPANRDGESQGCGSQMKNAHRIENVEAD